MWPAIGKAIKSQILVRGFDFIVYIDEFDLLLVLFLIGISFYLMKNCHVTY